MTNVTTQMADEITLKALPRKSDLTESMEQNLDALITLGEDEIRNTSKGSHLFMPSCLLTINSGTVYGGIFSVKDRESKFITESITLNGKTKISDHYQKAFTFKAEIENEVDEPCILISNRAHSNYYHWHLNSLPAILIASDLQLPWRFIVPQLNSWQRESLKMFNVPSEKLIELDNRSSLRCPRLYIPTSVFNELRHIGIEILSSFRRLALESIGKVTPHRKIYLARGDSTARILINEKELSDALQNVGFEIVTASELSYREQIKMFLETNFLVTCHGAGLTNIAWLPSDASIFEIRPKFWNMKMYERLANIRELDYHSHIVDGEPIRSSRWQIDDIPAMVRKITAQFASSNAPLWQKSGIRR